MKILINRSDAIGDTLLTLPIVGALKENLSHVEIGFLTSSRSQELFSMVEGVDRFWVLPKEKRKIFTKAQKVFREWSPDVYVYLGGTHIPSFCAWLNATPKRLGLQSRLLSFLFLNDGVRQKRSESLHHESGYNLQVLSPLIADLASETARTRAREEWVPKLEWSSEVEDKLNRYLKNLEVNFSREWIVVHPGMTGHSLNWRVRYYVEWIEELEKAFPERFLFLLSYTPSDRAYVEAFEKEICQRSVNSQVIYFNGKEVGLGGYAALLRRCSLFLGPSTGTTHMANILGTPTLCLYSPIPAQSAERWGPLWQNPQTRVLTPEVNCPAFKECLGERCAEYDCMDQITVERALNEAKSLLGGPD